MRCCNPFHGVDGDVVVGFFDGHFERVEGEGCNIEEEPEARECFAAAVVGGERVDVIADLF